MSEPTERIELPMLRAHSDDVKPNGVDAPVNGPDGAVANGTQGAAVDGPERSVRGADVIAAGGGPDRRTVLKWMALAAAVPAVGSGCGPDGSAGGAAGAGTGGGTGAGAGGGAAADGIGNPLAAGTPWDPDLIAPRRHWDLVLTDDEREGLAALCDVIIPADEVSPAASEVGAVDYIDEWVSAPYDGMRRDRVLIQGGLIWLDREATRRFGEGLRFRDLGLAQQTAICDDICWIRRAAAEHRTAARFFAKVRDLTATAFYTTAEGMADIGYVGNTALARWEAPPDEVLRHLGLV